MNNNVKMSIFYTAFSMHYEKFQGIYYFSLPFLRWPPLPIAIFAVPISSSAFSFSSQSSGVGERLPPMDLVGVEKLRGCNNGENRGESMANEPPPVKLPMDSLLLESSRAAKCWPTKSLNSV
jgi:hypothetical protein